METVVCCIITGVFSVLSTMIPMMLNQRKVLKESMKCSLRNDILSIYDICKKDKEISLYQLQAIEYSYTQYKSLGGNSFVDDIMSEVKLWNKI